MTSHGPTIRRYRLPVADGLARSVRTVQSAGIASPLAAANHRSAEQIQPVGRRRCGVDPVVGVAPGGGRVGGVGFGWVLGESGGRVVWVVLRLVWNATVSSASRSSVPRLW